MSPPLVLSLYVCAHVCIYVRRALDVLIRSGYILTWCFRRADKGRWYVVIKNVEGIRLCVYVIYAVAGHTH